MGNANYTGSVMKEPFTKDELKRLEKRFKKIDSDRSGGLSVSEFMKLPGVKENPLAHRIISIFDTDKDGQVDFNEVQTHLDGEIAVMLQNNRVAIVISKFLKRHLKAERRAPAYSRALYHYRAIVHEGLVQEFIGGMSMFSTRSEVGHKLKLYDVDQDGFISNGDLFRVLKMMVEDNLKDYQIQQLVDKTIIYFDSDNDGKLSFKEFTKVLTTMKDLAEMSTAMAFNV